MDEVNLPDTSEGLMELTAEVVAAYVSNHSLPVADLPALIADVHSALGMTGAQPEPRRPKSPSPPFR